VRRCHAAIRIVGTGVFKSGRVEFMAIPLMVVILGVLFLVFAVSAVGVWAWIVTGVVILAAIILLAWRGVQRHQHPPAADAPRPADKHRVPGAHRILVVVDESCAPGAIGEAVSARAAGRPSEAFVVAPAAGSRLDRLMGDEAGYSQAQSHLDETLAELAAIQSLDVKGGKVGSHDPIQAADESLREFPADEILFAFDPGASPGWLDDGAVELAESRYGIPVTKLVAAPTRSG
jgi:hypothetical protein